MVRTHINRYLCTKSIISYKFEVCVYYKQTKAISEILKTSFFLLDKMYFDTFVAWENLKLGIDNGGELTVVWGKYI